MTTAQRYFLAIAEAESISAAAEAMYVSQQNLSNFVKKLEAEYGVLFVRKPRFALTPAGEALLSAVREIRLIEQGLSVRVDELRAENADRLRLGMNMGRARVFLPPLLAGYYRDFPKVQLRIVHEETRNFEQLLLKGDINLFFGVNVSHRPEFTVTELGREPIYLAVSRELLCRAGIAAGESVISPQQAAALPLVVSPELSTLQQKVEDFFNSNRLDIKPRVVADDLDLQLALARRGVGACFCPEMLLGRGGPAEGELEVLRVAGMDVSNALSLVHHRSAYLSQALRGLMDMISAGLPRTF